MQALSPLGNSRPDQKLFFISIYPNTEKGIRLYILIRQAKLGSFGLGMAQLMVIRF